MFSNTCKYGIRAVVYIAGNSKNGENIGIKKISEDLNLPMSFLAKILQQMAKKKILNSSKGPHGGFSLAREPEQIFIIEVVKAIDGDDVFRRCVLHNYDCVNNDLSRQKCTLHDDYVKSRLEIKILFESKTVYDLVTNANNSNALY
ncbi:MAG TPA: Rrf2 family transcriptional regulator [Bacteroidetes bacterium]|nr:Rrf2 family transcriptional regulator [Bacteroidota bacterium]